MSNFYLSAARPVTVLSQSGAPSSVTGTTSETVLATIAIPAGAVGPNGAIRVTTLWSYTNNSNNKILFTRLGGVSVQGITNTTTSAMTQQIVIRSRGTSTSQITEFNSTSGFGSAAAGNFATTVDMTKAQNLTLSGAVAVGTDTITLEGYTVEILNP